MARNIYSSADFQGESPPPRLGGSEREYGINGPEGGYSSTYVNMIVGDKSIARVGLKKLAKGSFISDGAKFTTELTLAEYSSNEVLGPAAIANETTRGDELVYDIASKLERDIEEKVTIFSRSGNIDAVYENPGTYFEPHGYSSRGDHNNYLTIPEIVTLRDKDLIASFLATRPIYSGAGMLWIHDHDNPDNIHQPGFVLSQKALDLSHSISTRRTQARDKPMFNIHGDDGTDGAGSPLLPRAEDRSADALHSRYARWISHASTSLMLRVLEHKSMYTEEELEQLILPQPAQTMQRVSHDLAMVEQYDNNQGKKFSAIEHQKKWVELFYKLIGKVNLEHDELQAVASLDTLLDNIAQWRETDMHPMRRDETILFDRLEWSARLYNIKRKVGSTAISRLNIDAHKVDIFWDRKYPKGAADIWWKRKFAQQGLPDGMTYEYTEPEAYNTRADGRRALSKKFGKSLTRVAWHQIVAKPDGHLLSTQYDQKDPYNPEFELTKPEFLDITYPPDAGRL